METRIAEIIARLRAVRFRFTNEQELQADVNRVLSDYSFERETKLAPGERVDFIDDFGIVLETKIKRIGKMQLLRQLKRYARHSRVNAIIVITLFPVSVPPSIGEKPLHVVELWRSGL